jgi:thiosulfate/3-mercaptopyruvate sulfurtransferase
MPFTTLVSVAQLQAALGTPQPPVVIDTRSDLADPGAGAAQWRGGHVPGSIHLKLDGELSGTPTGPDGRFRGRHPLPERSTFAALLGRCGVGPDTQVVALDAHGGIYAARLWWLLRWMGHGSAAVLDGGLQAWVEAGGTLVVDAVAPPARPPYPERDPLVAAIDADALAARLGRVRLLDARAGERFRGDVEPLDKAAGHIPGALNRFYKDNLEPAGRFKPATQLRADFEPLQAGCDATQVVHSCGSGVTACHNLLAMEHAGLTGSRLYPGSWSEWSADPQRPLARG